MTIAAEVGRMYGQMTRQPRIEMFAESQTAFFTRTVDVQIDFVVEGGVVTHLVLHQNGSDFKAARK